MMDVRIEIESEVVKEKRIQTGSGEFTIYEQEAWLRIPGERYPQKCKMQLADGKSAHKIGEHSIDPRSVTVSQFGSVQLKKVLELKLEKSGATK